MHEQPTMQTKAIRHHETLAAATLATTLALGLFATLAIPVHAQTNSGNVTADGQVRLLERLRADFVKKQEDIDEKSSTQVAPLRQLRAVSQTSSNNAEDESSDDSRIRTFTTPQDGAVVPIREIKARIDAFRATLQNSDASETDRAEAAARFREAVAARVDDTNREAVRQEHRDEIEAKIAEARARLADKQTDLTTAAKERVSAYIDRVATRMKAALERLTKIADRLDSRIKKLQDDGLDMSKAVDLLTVARAELVIASDKIAAAQTAAQADVDVATSAREALAAASVFLREAKDSLQSAHKALVDAIREVKASDTSSSDTDTSSTSDAGTE